MYVVMLYDTKDAIYDEACGNCLEFTFEHEDDAVEFMVLWTTVKGYIALFRYDPSLSE